MMEIQNGGQASLVMKQLVEWMDTTDEAELGKMKAYIEEVMNKVDKPEAYLYSAFWSYLTDKGA